MSEATTTFALLKVDISDVKNQGSDANIDFWLVIKNELLQLKTGKKVTDAQICKFKTEVQEFLVTMRKHG